jgi:hypothetical protein
METVLEAYPTEEQGSVVLFVGKRLHAKEIHLFKLETVCHVKQFISRSRISLKDVRNSQMMRDRVRNWLRQQSKNFYAADFDALVKRRDKSLSFDGGYDEK